MDYTNLFYVIAAVLFILGIKRLSSPKTARTGNAIASIGMLIAIIATVSSFGGLDFKLIAIGMILGSILGATFALRVEMTQMPQMVAIFNGFGGGASALVATAEFFSKYGTSEQSTFLVTTIILSIFIGTLTLTGSFIAFGKLQGFISGQPIVFKGQQALNAIIMMGLIVFAVYTVLGGANQMNAFYVVIVLSAFKTASIPLTASLMLDTNSEYDDARATVFELI